MKKYKVYIVDDEPPILRSIKLLVEHSGFDIEVVGTAYDSEKARNEILSLCPDIVFADICMPHMDGIQLINACKSRLSHTSFVLISGYHDFNNVYRAIRSGIDDYLLKPIDPELFSKTLEKLVMKQQLYRFKYLQKQLKNAYYGTEYDLQYIKGMFDEEQWYLAGIKFGVDKQDLAEGLVYSEEELMQCIHEIKKRKKLNDFFILINNERYLWLFSNSKFSDPVQIEDLIGAIKKELKIKFSYTAVYHSDSISCYGIVDFWKKLDNKLKQLIVTEENQMIDLSDLLYLYDHKESLYRKACHFISQHYSEKITLQIVADFCQISQPLLSMLFREYRNQSFNEYLTIVRIDEAKCLIQEEKNDLRLGEIGTLVGYSDPYYFSRRFKAVVGLTPSEYKKQYSKGEKNDSFSKNLDKGI